MGEPAQLVAVPLVLQPLVHEVHQDQRMLQLRADWVSWLRDAMRELARHLNEYVTSTKRQLLCLAADCGDDDDSGAW